MGTQIVLLRGINIGSRNRIAMPALRGALTEARFGNVRTHLQSGNVLLDSELAPNALRNAFEELLAGQFGLNVGVVIRSAGELAEVVERNPLEEIATEPKRYQVSFLSEPLEQAVLEKLQSLAAPQERLVAIGRELYAWHPDGIARSKLWNGLAGKLGVTATARNWTTVTTLVEMANDD